MKEHILTYPNPSLPYVLFTDASKYIWACVLTQEETHDMEEKEVKILHPITYMSGLFRGSQMNWACLTKEAYAIYMSIRKLAYYLEDADITLRSDHFHPLTYKWYDQSQYRIFGLGFGHSGQWYPIKN